MADPQAKLEKAGIPLRQAIAQGKVTAADTASLGPSIDFGVTKASSSAQPAFKDEWGDEGGGNADWGNEKNENKGW
jgi:hypothetical protein